MSPKSAQRFWDNDMHKPKLKSTSVDALRHAPCADRHIRRRHGVALLVSGKNHHPGMV
jgi:hypothetical protein